MVKKSSPASATSDPSATELITGKIAELGDWRGNTLSRMRELIRKADPDVVEEWKWRGTPVWSHDGILCTGETYRSVVKLTFAKGAALKDPARLFNSSLEGNVRRAIEALVAPKDQSSSRVSRFFVHEDLQIVFPRLRLVQLVMGSGQDELVGRVKGHQTLQDNAGMFANATQAFTGGRALRRSECGGVDVVGRRPSDVANEQLIQSGIRQIGSPTVTASGASGRRSPPIAPRTSSRAAPKSPSTSRSMPTPSPERLPHAPMTPAER